MPHERLIEELAKSFSTRHKAHLLLSKATIPVAKLPFGDGSTPQEYWETVVTELDRGLVSKGIDRLQEAAAASYPENSIFQKDSASTSRSRNASFEHQTWYRGHPSGQQALVAVSAVTLTLVVSQCFGLPVLYKGKGPTTFQEAPASTTSENAHALASDPAHFGMPSEVSESHLDALRKRLDAAEAYRLVGGENLQISVEQYLAILADLPESLRGKIDLSSLERGVDPTFSQESRAEIYSEILCGILRSPAHGLPAHTSPSTRRSQPNPLPLSKEPGS